MRRAVGLVALALAAGCAVGGPAVERPPARVVELGGDPAGIAVSADGRSAYVAQEGAATLAVVDVPTGAVTDTVAVADRPRVVVLTADGRRAVVAGLGGAVVVDTAAGTVAARVDGITSATAAARTPDGGVVVADCPDGSCVLRLVDPATATAGAALPVPGVRVEGLAVGPDGRVFAAGRDPDVIAVVDLPGRRVATVIPAGVERGASPGQLVLSADGMRLFLAGSYGIVAFDTRSGAVAGRAAHHPGDEFAGPVTAGPDGRVYAVASAEGGWDVWVVDPVRVAVVARVPREGGERRGAALTPDGTRLLVTAGDDLTVLDLVAST